MPEDLRAHIRYPEDFFAIQARKYATYHMEDPQVFYNKEDLWAIPRRPIEGREREMREMEPYYTIMRLPDEQREEFILLTLFNPARRDNMIAWLAARSDPPHYGRLIAYNFPKQKLVFGPRQVDARIDQDPVISQQLALWNQRGSTVIRGSLLAIPIDQSLIYVQPLYLAAAEQGALPELRRVIVAYGNQIAMEPTLEQSLARIFGAAPGPPPRRRRPAPAPGPVAGVSAAAQRAWEIWTRAQDALRRGDWAAYGAEQKRLEEALRALLEPAPLRRPAPASTRATSLDQRLRADARSRKRAVEVVDAEPRGKERTLPPPSPKQRWGVIGGSGARSPRSPLRSGRGRRARRRFPGR